MHTTHTNKEYARDAESRSQNTHKHTYKHTHTHTHTHTYTHTQVVLKPLAVPDMQFSRVDGTSDALYAFELAVRAHTVCVSFGPVHTLERDACQGLRWVLTYVDATRVPYHDMCPVSSS